MSDILVSGRELYEVLERRLLGRGNYIMGHGIGEGEIIIYLEKALPEDFFVPDVYNDFPVIYKVVGKVVAQ